MIEIKEVRRAEIPRARDEDGTCVTIVVKNGELTVSRLRLSGRSWSTATVDGQIAERDGDAILLGEERILKAGDCLAVELNRDGEA